MDRRRTNHHGSLEEENPFWLATLRSRVMIVPACAATHPSLGVDYIRKDSWSRVYYGTKSVQITSVPFEVATCPLPPFLQRMRPVPGFKV